MEDLVYLLAHHTVVIHIDNRSMGTMPNRNVSLAATATVENAKHKLTASASAWGESDGIEQLREEVARDALARLRRQVEALEALK